jgi:hypothetical protein
MLKKLFVLAVFMTQFATAHAFTVGTPTAFNGLTWFFTSGVTDINSCTQLVLDATGDLGQGNALGMHGFLNCSNGAYAVDGTAYFGVNGTLNMTLQIGAGVIAACNNLGAFSGACTMYNGIGTIVGSASISFL